MPEREPIDPLIFGEAQTCFGCGPRNHAGMNLRFFREGDEVVTTLESKAGWDGPPGVLHGGLQATLADEVGAWTLVGLRGRFGLTSGMQLRYYRPARMDRPIEARGAIVEETARGIVVRVCLLQDDRKVLSGTITYVVPTIALAEKLIGGPLPEAWRRLTADGPG